MYKWKKGDGVTMAFLGVGAVIGIVLALCGVPSPMDWIDNLFTRAADFVLIFIFLAVSGVISFINRLFK